MTHMQTVQPTARRGRPPIDPAARVQVRSIRLTDAEWAKLRRLGMARLRAWLSRVKERSCTKI